MCGICGYRYAAPARFEAAPIGPMTEALRHRGPDAGGLWSDAACGVALGHRRLKVLDLSERAAQPMSAADSRVRLVYNGEWYDYAETKRELTKRGCRFVSESDTEVLLQAYLSYGPDFLRALNGDFAFAIWDERVGELHLARDRVGVRPLYLSRQNGVVAFASEIKALFLHPAMQKRPNLPRLRDYLSALCVFGGETLYENVQEVQPGEWLTIGTNGSITTRRYFDFAYDPAVRALPLAERGERFDALLDDAIRLRLVSDVPLGLYLSGGVDSSYLAARAAERGAKLAAYSLGFGAGLDEFAYSAPVAARYAQHSEAFELGPFDFEDTLARLLGALDGPTPHPVAIPQYFLAQRAKRHITVALSGTGGDELLAGYGHYAAALALHEGRLSLAGLSPQRARYQRALTPSLIAAEFKSCTQKDLVDILAPGAEDYRDSCARYFEQSPYPDFLSSMLYMDFKTHVVQMMNKEDRMNMAWGVEGRFPYLDHRLIAFCLSLSPADKLRGGQGKWLLKQRAARYFAPEFLERPKQAFPTPLARWLSASGDVLLFPALRECLGERLNWALIERWRAEQQTPAAPHTRRLFGLVQLDRWLARQFT